MNGEYAFQDFVEDIVEVSSPKNSGRYLHTCKSLEIAIDFGTRNVDFIMFSSTFKNNNSEYCYCLAKISRDQSV